MPGRLDRIEALLRAALGDALIDRCPDMTYNVNQTLVRFGRTQDTLSMLLTKLDSSLFNAVYLGTERTMLVVCGGMRMRVTTDRIHDLADRLLALVYESAPVTPELQAMLFDFSREAGSFAAMRALAARFPMDEFERAYLVRVLEENEQTE